MARKIVSLIGGLLLTPLSALAHENAPYLELGIGRTAASGDLRQEGAGTAGTPAYDVDYATVVSYAIGYQMVSGLRIELDFRNRDIDTGGVHSVPTRPPAAFIGVPTEEFTASGVTRSQTRMLNIAYVGYLVKPRWSAYLKLGAGEAKNRASATIDLQPINTLFGLEPVVYEQGSNREFAWSAGAGMHAHLGDQIELGLDYQYSNLGDAVTAASVNGDRLEHDQLAVHELSIRVRYSF